jgi:hypothetical protein
MIPAATYPAVVVPVTTDSGQELMCQFGHTKDQKPQVAITYEILRGPYAGQKLTWVGFFTEKTTDTTMKTFRVSGFTGDDLDKFNDQRPDIEVNIVVQDKIGQDGKTYSEIRWVNDPLRGGGFVLKEQMDAKQTRLFAAQFKTALKAYPAIQGKKAVREAPSAAPAETSAADGGSGWSGNDAADPPKAEDYNQAPPVGSDDDIPF